MLANSLPGLAQKALPGKIEAESYSAKQGVSTETTADTDGGLDVGWIGKQIVASWPP
ncbi:hypothetical protein [Spirosoma migulaei]